jgi:phage/plasmid-associated DNA primase
MGLSRRQFTKKFKLAAVRRLEQGVSIAEVARGLEVNSNVLHRWRREFRAGPGNVFPGNGKQRWSEGRVAEHKDLPAKLRTELPGVLRWITEGAVLYHREGLGDAPDVMAATEQYRQESDRLKEFFEDRCAVAGDSDANSWKREKFCVPVTDLYPAYLGWSAANGDKHPLSKGLFDERLQKLGRKQDRVRPDGGRDTNQIRVWLGIRLRAAEDD